MSPAKHNRMPDPAQETLFGYNPVTDSVYPENSVMADTHVSAKTIEHGASVNVEERAVRLLKAMDELAQISKRDGFNKFSYTSSGAKGIGQRYGADSNKVLTGSNARIDDNKAIFRSNFGKAFGKEQMEKDKNISQELAKRMLSQEISGFENKYGGPGEGAKNRIKLRRQLNKTLKSKQENAK